ncbi:MAG TPA: hypothetical protein ENG48_11460 [Candidatus Atribacteria bacterium]|nr:hypothetical protein [Candidatus Atribacteria bacterium]
MAFKEIIISYAPDIDKEKHRSFVNAGKYHQFSVVVKNQVEAIEVCEESTQNKNIEKVTLCPACTHEDVVVISKVTGNNMGVSVERADGSSNIITAKGLKRENFKKRFSKF